MIEVDSANATPPARPTGAAGNLSADRRLQVVVDLAAVTDLATSLSPAGNSAT